MIHWRNVWSTRTVSQFSSSVRLRLMPSLMANSRASSLTTSASVLGSMPATATPIASWSPGGAPPGPRAPRRRWTRGLGASHGGMLALRAAESTRLCPRPCARVGLADGEVVALVVAHEAVAESVSRCCRMDSCSSCRRRYRCSVRSRLCRGMLSRAGGPPPAMPPARLGNGSVDAIMATAFGVDLVGLWDGFLWLEIAAVARCGGVFGVNARMLIVYDLEWDFEAGIGSESRYLARWKYGCFISFSG